MSSICIRTIETKRTKISFLKFNILWCFFTPKKKKREEDQSDRISGVSVETVHLAERPNRTQSHFLIKLVFSTEHYVYSVESWLSFVCRIKQDNLVIFQNKFCFRLIANWNWEANEDEWPINILKLSSFSNLMQL